MPESQVSTMERPKEVPKLGKSLESFAFYVNDAEKRAKNSIRNRLIGKLSIGTEKGRHAPPELKRNIIEVQSRATLDRGLGLSLVEHAQSAVEHAAEQTGIDMDSILGSTQTDEHGVKRILTIGVDRSSERNLPTQGHPKDTLDFTVTTLGVNPGEGHTINYSVGYNGEVSMTGPNGEVSRVHGGSEAAARMVADIQSFPPPEYAFEHPF